MKVGDYGFVTRRYYYPRSAERSFNAHCGRIIITVILLGVVAFWVHTERAHVSYKAALGDMLKGRVSEWMDGKEIVRQAESTGETRSFLLSGVTVEKTSPLTDADFGLQVTDSLSLHREVEYCQWEEYRHERRVNDDEVEVTYTHIKGWRKSRIPSLLFSNPVAFHNPMRDPFPSMAQDSVVVVRTNDGVKGIAGGLARGSKADERWDDVLIPRDLPPTPKAVREGCTRSDGRWIYCQAAPGSTFGGLASFLFDGVISLGFSGSCEPGDIRVRWSRVPQPPVATIVAMPVALQKGVSNLPATVSQQDLLEMWHTTVADVKVFLEPTTLDDGTVSYFFLPGKRSLTDIEREFVSRAKNSMFITRLVNVIVISLLSFVLWTDYQELKEEEDVARLRKKAKDF